MENSTKTRRLVAVLALTLASVGITGCSSSEAPPVSPSTPATGAATSGKQAIQPQSSGQQLSAEQQQVIDREQNGGQPATK